MTRPMDCEEASQPNDVQGSSSLNESFDEQQVDLVRMETDAGEWMVVKKRNGKSRVVSDNAVVVTSLGDPVCLVEIDVDSLCGVTTRSGIWRTSVLPRSKGLKALALALGFRVGAWLGLRFLFLTRFSAPVRVSNQLWLGYSGGASSAE
ncbi:hypothetical protein IMY05_013G0073900 [Salix suchowensis]|nr:hypothetical protein IMY05_013G0073900 [Salix suchowensis]